jgi:hypothetical protein
VLTAFRDYISINFARMRKAFLIIYFCYLIGHALVIYRNTNPDLFGFTLIEWPIVLLIVVLAFVLVVALGDTYLRCKALARSHGMSIAMYVRSEHYQQHRKDKLRRTDPDLKWF